MRPVPMLVALLLAGCAHPTADPDRAAIDRLQTEAKASRGAFETVRSLTDRVGPRLAGSEGDRAAVAWGLEAMKEIGLANVRAEPAMVPHWERGAEAAELTAPSRRAIALTALGGSIGTPPEGLEGDVVLARTLEEVDQLGDRARGKIVFVNVVMQRTKDGSGYGAAVGARGAAAIRASRVGAIAVVVRSIGTDENRLPHTGAFRYDDAVPKIPAAALAIPDAELLARLLDAGTPVRLRLTLGARWFAEAPSANVVGEIVGAEKPTETVVIGAHLDSWDLGQGAIDDGAGCAIVLESARRIRALGVAPRRTIRFVLFANEENGTAGAKAYASAHAGELDGHVLALEADLGAGAVLGVRHLGGPDGKAAFAALDAALAPLGVVVIEGHAHGGADVGPLRMGGVPLLDLSQDASSYFDFHHTANDTLDKVDPATIAQATAAYATAVFVAARTPLSFGRVPEDDRKLP